MYSTSVYILQIWSMQSARVSEGYKGEANYTLKCSFFKQIILQKCNMQSLFIILSLADSPRIKWKRNHHTINSCTVEQQ